MIKNNIKRLRSEKGLTQRQLAEQAGTSQQQIQRIEAGLQAARVDLADRIATALGVSLNDLFPDLAKLKFEETPSPWGDEAELVAEAGVELDPCLYTFRVRLRGGLERDFPVSARDRSRLRRMALDWDRPQIAVFDTPAERVAINMQALSLCQFLFDPVVSAEMADGTSDVGEGERDGLKVWLVEGGEPLWFGVEYDDKEDDDGELGNVGGLFHDLEIADEERPVSFEDEDGEEVILLSSHVALCTVPLAYVSRALFEAEAEGEEEDEAGAGAE